MAGIETVSAIISLLDICMTRGKQIYQVCKAFSNAEKELAERELRVRSNWMRISHQLEYISRETVNRMRPELANNFRDVLETLATKLSKVLRKLVNLGAGSNSNGDRLKPPTRRLSDQMFKKFKYIIVKESLDTAIQELEMWRRLFDPSWFLLIKAASPAVIDDTAKSVGCKLNLTAAFPVASGLQSPPPEADQMKVFITASELEHKEIIDPQFVFSKVCLGSRKGRTYILDLLERPDGAEAATYPKHLRTLARKLSSTDPAMSNLLSCKGVIKEESQYTMVFSIPAGLDDAHSLRVLLSLPAVALTERFRIAKDLAKSVSYVHSYGYVHKNIRPETVWLMSNKDKHSFFTFLLGFEQFRHEDGRTGRIGDQSWEKNLYRHPERQGSTPQALYQMQHDIYSLGVCLLEIGLWESLVVYDSNHTKPKPANRLLSNLNAEQQTRAVDNGLLLKMAKEVLPINMGDIYSQIVQTCLTCLDDENMDFGNVQALEDEDGIRVGVRYIEKILGRLNEIQV